MTEALEGIVEVSRRIAAPADRIFAVLAAPSRHTEIDGSGMLRGPVDAADVTGVGDTFAMNMFFDRFGGPYLMINHVVEFEPNRRIAWAPGPGDEITTNDGEFRVGEPAGHRWCFELEPDGDDATIVTERYDCRQAPERLRQAIGQGAAWTGAMTATLEKLAEVCE